MAVRKRRSDRSGRGALPSPGRPFVARREDRRQFWAAIAAGRSSEDAAVQAGLRKPKSRLANLRSAWKLASEEDRQDFLREVGAA